MFSTWFICSAYNTVFAVLLYHFQIINGKGSSNSCRYMGSLVSFSTDSFSTDQLSYNTSRQNIFSAQSISAKDLSFKLMFNSSHLFFIVSLTDHNQKDDVL